ncbi:hypothetical protein PINS_up002922 [Pythium insidiosum]|nr:hypothetical protein PINS_up002922 [Pythium insidiosum]
MDIRVQFYNGEDNVEVVVTTRQINNGEEDVEVVVTTRVPESKWLKSSTDRFRSVIIEARWFGDERVADLIITKLRGRAHECAVGEIFGQLRDYAVFHDRVLAAGGGDMILQFPNHGAHVTRCPDTALQPELSAAGEAPADPRLIVEVARRLLIHACLSR